MVEMWLRDIEQEMIAAVKGENEKAMQK